MTPHLDQIRSAQSKQFKLSDETLVGTRLDSCPETGLTRADYPVDSFSRVKREGGHLLLIIAKTQADFGCACQMASEIVKHNGDYIKHGAKVVGPGGVEAWVRRE